jgi:hypothetical protein
MAMQVEEEARRGRSQARATRDRDTSPLRRCRAREGRRGRGRTQAQSGQSRRRLRRGRAQPSLLVQKREKLLLSSNSILPTNPSSSTRPFRQKSPLSLLGLHLHRRQSSSTLHLPIRPKSPNLHFLPSSTSSCLPSKLPPPNRLNSNLLLLSQLLSSAISSTSTSTLTRPLS